MQTESVDIRNLNKRKLLKAIKKMTGAVINNSDTSRDLGQRTQNFTAQYDNSERKKVQRSHSVCKSVPCSFWLRNEFSNLQICIHFKT